MKFVTRLVYFLQSILNVSFLYCKLHTYMMMVLIIHFKSTCFGKSRKSGQHDLNIQTGNRSN